MLSKKSSVERDIAEELSQMTDAGKKRSKMHSKNTVHWLRKRFHQTANINYLHFPEELRKELDVQNIFRNFDEDNSGKLGLGEFHKMLKEAHIDIDLEDLKLFYEKVDTNQDVALDYQEFKNCTLSDDANRHFSQMVNKFLEKTKSPPIQYQSSSESPWKNSVQPSVTEGNFDSKQSNFLPRSFGNMMNFIAYRTKKNRIIKIVNNESTPTPQKFEGFRKLIDLKMDKDVYMEHLSTKYDAPLNHTLQKGLSLASPKASNQNKAPKTLHLSLNKTFTNNFPTINFGDNETTKTTKGEITQITAKAQEKAYQEIFERELKRTHPSRFIDFFAERSFSVASPEEQPSFSAASPKGLQRLIKSPPNETGLNSPSGRLSHTKMLWNSGRDPFLVNIINQTRTGSFAESKIPRGSYSIQQEPASPGKSGVMNTVESNHEPVRIKFPQKKLRGLDSPAKGFRATLCSEESLERFETQETHPSDRMFTQNDTALKASQNIENYLLNYSPKGHLRAILTEMDEPRPKDNILLTNLRKPSIKSHITSNSISYSKMPRDYINVAAVYESKTKKSRHHIRLNAVLQNGSHSTKKPLDLLGSFGTGYLRKK